MPSWRRWWEQVPVIAPNLMRGIQPLFFVRVNPYSSAMDLEARRRIAENRPHVLRCEHCGRRIAWWTRVRARVGNDLMDRHSDGWRWQGKRSPIQYRMGRTGFPSAIAVECFACGWTRTFDGLDVMLWSLLDPRGPSTVAQMRAALLKDRRAKAS